MENQNRVGKVLLLLAGFALVLCAGMAIGGLLVYGVMRIGDLRSSDVELGDLNLPFKDLDPEEVEEFSDEGLEDLPGPQFARGAVIVEVLPGTPAEEAGLQEGDVVVAVDSRRIGPAGNLARLIALYEPGDRVTLQVRRGDNDVREVRVRLGENPEAPGMPYLGVRYESGLPQGLQLREMLPFDEDGELPWDRAPVPMPGMPGSGTMIVSVTEGSPAEGAGLQHGDLISALDGEPVANAESFSDAIAGHRTGDRITLTVVRAGDEITVEVQLGEHPDQADKAYLGVTIINFSRQFRGLQDEGQLMPQDEMPFSWDDLRRWFEMQPSIVDDGSL